MNLIACTRADQLKPSLWAQFHVLTAEALINNLADAQAKNEALAQENARLLKENAALKSPEPAKP